MELLFTYGTLMKGQKAHNSYPDMSYISDAVLPDYGLYEASEENYPCAVPVKGFNVSGEVILLMKKFLKKLNEYEEEGDIYIVKKTKVLAADNEELNVWFYEYDHDVK